MAGTRRRIEGLDAPDAGDQAGPVEPRRPEAPRASSEAPDAGRRGTEGPDAATAAGTDGRTAAEVRPGAEAEPGPVARNVATALDLATAAAAANGAPAKPGDDGARAGGERYTAVNPVNLRAEPRNGAEVVTVVEEGDTVRRIDSRGGWLRVEYTSRRGARFTGWVFSRYLRRAEASPRSGVPPGGDGS